MPRHDAGIALRQMLDHAREAIAFAKGKKRGDLDVERWLQLVLVHLIEIVGEAANRVSPAVRSSVPVVAWAKIINMRHRLVHGYDTIDLEVVWRTVQAGPA